MRTTSREIEKQNDDFDAVKTKVKTAMKQIITLKRRER
jgi:hypothetical protein